jgi:hypothetical protein
METIEAGTVLSRKKIAVRFLYTIFFVIVLEILKTIIQLTVLFQYVYLFITTTYSNPVIKFSNKVSVYAYRVMRYITLNENDRPFPFSDFPQEIDPPEPEVHFE